MLASKPHENPPRPRWFPPVQPSTSSPTPPTTTTTQPLPLPCSLRHPSPTTRSSRPRQRTTLIVPHSLRHLRAELAIAVINTTTTTSSGGGDDDDDIDGADSDASANTTFSRRVRRRARAERDLREEWVDVGEEAYGHARRAPVADRSSATDSGGGSDAEGGQWEGLNGEKELEVSSFEEEKERRRIKKEARAERRRRGVWRDVDGLEEDGEDGDEEEGDDEIEEWEEVEKEEARGPESSLSALRFMDQVFKTLSKL
ncbi:hypothetical protein DBV05_g2752 [Lasiodiplodia theobromae]|uniref:Uncharacterized protein n=1 Tax=Lasiodiplodia theobromae TaxID=45133 RepID=A0A5N5DNX6_9PEZI|nr:hypothetical protein DBV05_g2752 [Lasiodiplodia theobromae]